MPPHPHVRLAAVALALATAFAKAQTPSPTTAPDHDRLPDLAGSSPKGGPAYNVSAGAGGANLERRDAGSRLSLRAETSQRTGGAVGLDGGLALSDAVAFGGGLLLGADKRDFYANLGWAFSPAQRLVLAGGQLRQNLDFDFPSGRARADLAQSGGGLSYRMTLGSGLLDHLELNAYRASSDSRELGAINYAIDTATLYELWLDPRRIAGGRLAGVQGRAGLVPWSGGSLDLGVGRERLRYDERAGADSQTRTTARFEIAQAVSAATRIKFGADAGAAQTRYTTGFDVALEGGRLGVALDVSRGRDGAPDDRRLQVSWTLPLTRVARTASASGSRAAPGALLDQVAMRPTWLPAQVIARVDITAAPTRLIAVDKTTVPAGATVDKATGTVSAPLGVAAGSITGVTRNGATFTNAGQFALAAGAIVINTALIEQPAAGVRDTYVVTVANVDGGTTLITVVVSRGSVRIESISVSTVPAAPAASADDTNNLIVLGTGVVAANLEVSADGGAYAAYSAGTPYAGNHTVKLRVKAMNGNPAGLDTTLAFTEAAPTAPSVSADDTHNLIVLGAGVIAANLEVSLDGGAYAAYNAATTYAGNHSINVRLKAMNGNPAGAATTLSFTEVAPAAPAVTADDSADVIVLGAGVLAANLEVSADGSTYAAYSAATTYAGAHTVKVRVKAMNGHPAGAEATLNFSVAAPVTTPPVMGNVPDQPALAVNTAYALALAGYVTQTDGHAITGYRIASGSLPSGLALNAGTGAITGTPTLAGGYTVTVQAQDADGWSNADQVVFTVAAAANVAPSFSTPPTNQTVGKNTNSAVNIAVADAETAAAALVVTATSSNQAIVQNANIAVAAGAGGARTITVTPQANATGTVTINVAVSDGTATTNTSYTVTFTHAAPTLAAQGNLSWTQAQAVNVQLSAGADSDAAETLTYSIAAGALPAGVNFTAATRTLSGTPTTAQGATAYTYRVTDASGLFAERTFNITVANTVPVAADVSVASADAGFTVVHDLAADISDAQEASASLTVVVVAGPTKGTLAWTDTSFVFTTDGGRTGNDSFTYKVRDSGGLESAVKTVTLTGLSG